MKPFAFRTPVAIPELGAEAGDWIERHPDNMAAVYVVRTVCPRVASDAFTRLRALASLLPPDAHAPAPPIGRHIRRVK